MTDRDLTEPVIVMLGRAWQTAWIMKNLHDKSTNLPEDPDTFAFDKLPRLKDRIYRTTQGKRRRWKCILCKSIVLVVIAIMHYKFFS